MVGPLKNYFFCGFPKPNWLYRDQIPVLGLGEYQLRNLILYINYTLTLCYNFLLGLGSIWRGSTGGAGPAYGPGYDHAGQFIPTYAIFVNYLFFSFTLVTYFWVSLSILFIYRVVFRTLLLSLSLLFFFLFYSLPYKKCFSFSFFLALSHKLLISFLYFPVFSHYLFLSSRF